MLDTTHGIYKLPLAKACFLVRPLITDLFGLQLGTAMCYQVQTLYDPVFETNDPRAWRNECTNPGSTARLSDILNEWKDDYAQLRLIGQTNGNGLVHAETSGEEYKVRIDC